VHGDLTSKATLVAANCQAAKTIIITSGNDAFNLEAAFKARELNPEAEIYIRLYRKGLASLIDAATMPNVHFFCPYDRAAENLAGKINVKSP
jgi:voltage-gated potassium channel Kch